MRLKAPSPKSSSASNGNTGTNAERSLNSISLRLGIAASIVTILGFIVAVITLVGQHSGLPATARSGQAPAASPSAVPSISQPRGHSRRLTAAVVKQGLLNSAELATIDRPLKASDIDPADPPPSQSCKGGTTHPTYDPTRRFSDGTNLDMIEQIDAFSSLQSAERGFSTDSKYLTCGFTSARNASRRVAGLCDQGYAAEMRETQSGYQSEAVYAGALQCGRFVVILALLTPSDNSFDQIGKFALFADTAVPKIQHLPGS